MKRLSLAVVGYGRMGKAVERVAERRGHRVEARIDRDVLGESGAMPSDLGARVDVAIEFSTPEAAEGNCAVMLEQGVPVVSGTTAWEDGLARVRALSSKTGTAFLWAPNYALGVQVMLQLVERAAQCFDGVEGFDPSLHECHHAGKRDAPSGTARALAERVVANDRRKTRCEPAPSAGTIEPEVLSMSWTRAGHEPGSHALRWDSVYETLEIVHRVRDRAVFAYGAVRAAEWLSTRSGPQTLENLLEKIMSGSTEGSGARNGRSE